ncbi:MAG: hypothetical protein Q7K55_01010 [Candidatus Levybacteria bacterium]|nr:hypothetical protein [Candidatus Levybacteria bacterium]
MNTQELKDILEEYFKTSVIGIEKADGGLVHYVYRITTKNKIMFAKHRVSYFAKLPKIQTKPEFIKYEKRALDIFSKLAPEVFPKVLRYFPKKYLLILSDIMPNRKTLEKELNEHSFNKEEAFKLGKLLAEIHIKLSSVKLSIREDGDKEFYKQLLFYRFGYQDIPTLKQVIAELNSLTKQLIIGDLSPKNIGVSGQGKFTICDLENVHMGNTASDVGFLACSLIIHTINNYSLAHRLLLNFLQGYNSKINEKTDDSLLKRIIMGISLYRLDNPVIPYDIAITENEKKIKITEIKRALNLKKISWEELVKTLTLNKSYEN